MARDQWTIVLLAGENGPLRQINLSRRNLQVAAGGLAVLALVFIGLLGSLGMKSAYRLEAGLLKEQNRVLAAELAGIRSRMQGLEGDLTFLAQRDAEARLLAGLTPIDEEVLRVGVGGPGSPSLEDQELYQVDPDRAKEVFAVEYDLGAMERRVGLFRSSLSEAIDSLQSHEALLHATPSILPTAGLLRSGFTNARLHPILNRSMPHQGIDVAAPRGTPILAAARGRVILAGWKSGYGFTVELDHGYGYRTLYAHADKVMVRVGQTVERGEVIAQVGSTGLATSPHLHYEVTVRGQQVNPMNFIMQGMVP
jgi:murein DD-endopeptidase MepM/ murein hydrolase activator NlpD